MVSFRRGLRLFALVASVVVIIACGGSPSDETSPVGPSSSDSSGGDGGSGGSGGSSGPSGPASPGNGGTPDTGGAPNGGGAPGGASSADVEITARVNGRAGTCPNLTFNAGTQRVATTAATFFRRVACELLVNDQLVEVEGPIVSGVLRAEKVQLEDAEGIDRRGAVSALAGRCSAVSFSVGGQTFFTNGTTEFKDLACSDLRDGLNVRADGHVQSNGQALAERVRPR